MLDHHAFTNSCFDFQSFPSQCVCHIITVGKTLDFYLCAENRIK